MTSDEDRRLLAGICNRNGWHLLFADTCEEARAALDKLKAPVILCDRDLPGKGWRETVEDLASSPHRACIILVSGVLDAYLWDEVVRTGGYDVLYKPLREDDVVRSVRLAWSYWNSATRNSGASRQETATEILGDYALPHSVQNQLGKAVQIELVLKVPAVRLHRVKAEVK